MKKAIGLVLTAAMLMGLAVGCGSSNSNSSTTEATAGAAASEAAASTEDKAAESEAKTDVQSSEDLSGTITAAGSSALKPLADDAADAFYERYPDVLDADSLGKAVSKLSGGMRRRVAIVRAMASDADVIFMDEPFTGLDVSTRQQVIAYILKKQEGRLMLIVTHQLQDAQLLGARAIQMENMTVSE